MLSNVRMGFLGSVQAVRKAADIVGGGTERAPEDLFLLKKKISGDFPIGLVWFSQLLGRLEAVLANF